MEWILRGASFSVAKPATAGQEIIRCREADLTGAKLDGAYLHGLEGARLVAAEVQATSTVLHDANLRGAWFKGANLRFARLFRADLAGAHLCQAKLRNGGCSGSMLRRCQYAGRGP